MTFCAQADFAVVLRQLHAIGPRSALEKMCCGDRTVGTSESPLYSSETTGAQIYGATTARKSPKQLTSLHNLVCYLAYTWKTFHAKQKFSLKQLHEIGLIRAQFHVS